VEETLDPAIGPIELDYDADVSDNETTVIVETKVNALEEVQHIRLHTPPLTYEIPRVPQNVEFAISGTGCAVLQSRVYWKTTKPIPPEIPAPLAIFVTMKSDVNSTDQEVPVSITVDVCVQ
jgi:hypothetical protein